MNKNLPPIFMCVALVGTLSCASKKQTQLKTVTPKIAEQKVDVKYDKIVAQKDEEKASSKPTKRHRLIFPYTANGPVATINGEEISAETFNHRVRIIFPKWLKLVRNRASVELWKMKIIDEFVNRRIVEKAVASTLKNVSAEALEEEFNRTIDEMIKTHGNIGVYESTGTTETELRRRIKTELAFKAMLSKKHNIIVSKGDIEDFYVKHKSRFVKEAQVKASHILFKAKHGDKKTFVEAKKRAMVVYKLAKKPGADFAALAREKSEGPGAAKGGELGFFSKGRMVREFSKAAFAAPKGSITKPVKTRFGYHIIKVSDKTKREVTPLYEASSLIKHELEEPKMTVARQIYHSTQREIQKVEILLKNVIDNPNFKL